MISKYFFNKSKININDISFNNFSWENTYSDDKKIQWENLDFPASLSINFFNFPPDIPKKLHNKDFLLSFYRQQIVNANGGLLKFEIIEIDGFIGIETLFKLPIEPSGLVYLSTFTFPFKNFSFVIKIQAFEEGITGARETVIFDKLLKENKIELIDDEINNWFADPYDKNFNEALPMNQSEKEEYDYLFENHPLSFIRTVSKKLKTSIKIHEKLKEVEQFT